MLKGKLKKQNTKAPDLYLFSCAMLTQNLTTLTACKNYKEPSKEKSTKIRFLNKTNISPDEKLVKMTPTIQPRLNREEA